MTAKPIEIIDYDPEWPLQFELLRRFFESQLGELIHEIHHVGSTAVPGLSAKPVIDLDIVLKELSQLDDAIDQLGGLGYAYLGEMGITFVYLRSAERCV